LRKLPRETQERILLGLALLRDTPRPPGAKKLSGRKEIYRLRIGEWRILYTIKDRGLLVLVIKIGHRREAYRLA